MRVATWNVNGIRARLPALLAWLGRTAPDLVCLQETKVDDGLFPAAALAAAGYAAVWHGQAGGYAGVAVLGRGALTPLGRGLEDGDADPEARLVGAAAGGIEVWSVYVPNGQAPGTEKFEWKLEYLERLRNKLRGLVGRPAILAGDFNVAPADRDVWNPAAWRGRILCTDEERRGWTRLCAAGFVDAVRRLHPETPMFSWWDYRGFAPKAGVGAPTTSPAGRGGTPRVCRVTSRVFDSSPSQARRFASHHRYLRWEGLQYDGMSPNAKSRTRQYWRFR